LNKIVSIKKTSPIFLAIVLVAGTIAAFSPSSITASAQTHTYYDGMDDKYNSYEPEPQYPQQYAEKEYNSYEQPEYGMDRYEKPSYRNDYYERPEYPPYGKDNNGYKSKKDISNSVSLNKLNCINNNVNINGINTGDINVGASGILASSPGTDEGYLGVGSSDGNSEGYDNGYNEQKGESFNCIINNNNINNNLAGNATDGNVIEPFTCE